MTGPEDSGRRALGLRKRAAVLLLVILGIVGGLQGVATLWTTRGLERRMAEFARRGLYVPKVDPSPCVGEWIEDFNSARSIVRDAQSARRNMLDFGLPRTWTRSTVPELETLVDDVAEAFVLLDEMLDRVPSCAGLQAGSFHLYFSRNTPSKYATIYAARAVVRSGTPADGGRRGVADLRRGFELARLMVGSYSHEARELARPLRITLETARTLVHEFGVSPKVVLSELEGPLVAAGDPERYGLRLGEAIRGRIYHQHYLERTGQVPHLWLYHGSEDETRLWLNTTLDRIDEALDYGSRSCRELLALPRNIRGDPSLGGRWSYGDDGSPWLDRYADHHALRRELDLARIGLAIEVHIRDEGAWPVSLEELAPHFPGGLPVDPCGGSPYRLVRSAGRLSLEPPEKTAPRSHHTSSSYPLLQWAWGIGSGTGR